MRVMGIDYGDARTGIAISDEMNMLVGDAFTITEWNPDVVAEKIVAEAKARNVKRLVLGLPKNMDGTEGPRAEKCREFAEKIKALTDIELVMWDERRSSIEAHAILHANGKKEKKHRKTVDAVAASIILEGYLGTMK